MKMTFMGDRGEWRLPATQMGAGASMKEAQPSRLCIQAAGLHVILMIVD